MIDDRLQPCKQIDESPGDSSELSQSLHKSAGSPQKHFQIRTSGLQGLDDSSDGYDDDNSPGSQYCKEQHPSHTSKLFCFPDCMKLNSGVVTKMTTMHFSARWYAVFLFQSTHEESLLNLSPAHVADTCVKNRQINAGFQQAVDCIQSALYKDCYQVHSYLYT